MENKTWKLALICFLAVFFFTSCDDDDEYYYVGNGNSWISYGNLEKVDNSQSKYVIRRDDGNKLILSEGVRLNGDEVKEGLRVVANYSIIGSEREETSLNGKMIYYIRLYDIDDVLCKVPVKESFIKENEAVRNDSIGNDPINITEAWFGGKYLNVEFKIPVKKGSSEKHFINLVQDDMGLHNDSVYITLRHNAYGEKPDAQNTDSYVWSYGRVSFDLTSIVPEGYNKVPVKLIWTEYKKNIPETVTKSDSGTFSLSGKETNPRAKSGLKQKENHQASPNETRISCELK
ncbi:MULTISPECIES: NigD1/NigD2 family lipoprotein [Sanguibacteroides]|uniref:NigD-like C-terminal domain-containing protein n=1 Tax=Sanguibacteroides justesenii TaxID=1547597 RepID=A0A0C3RJ27_9PORP|nr:MULTISPECIES: NigD-like C-terminal domain-containing protein [Sanguibacteroides]KIO44247.1 hypothetical protein IE90_09235 [Sanguibacteroides justesenii]KIO47616.1 hypothetical protein BA92_00180 [Sanguibacteroides justesenii]